MEVDRDRKSVSRPTGDWLPPNELTTAAAPAVVAAALARLAKAVPRMGTAARVGDRAARPAAIAGAAKPGGGREGEREHRV